MQKTQTLDPMVGPRPSSYFGERIVCIGQKSRPSRQRVQTDWGFRQASSSSSTIDRLYWSSSILRVGKCVHHTEVEPRNPHLEGQEAGTDHRRSVYQEGRLTRRPVDALLVLNKTDIDQVLTSSASLGISGLQGQFLANLTGRGRLKCCKVSRK